MAILLKRAYGAPAPTDGCRVLVERLWPRGLSKADAHIDLWMKELAPSSALRRWFGHDPAKWEEFRRRYRAELAGQAEAMARLRELVAAGPVTFVFAAREERFNNAVALKELLEART